MLDTGAGSSFIKKELLSKQLTRSIQPSVKKRDVRDANNRRVAIEGTIRLAVRLGTHSDYVNSNVVDKLATDIIFGCDYMDKHVQSLLPRRRIVELAGGSTVPIINRFTNPSGKPTVIPDDEKLPPAERRVSNKINTTNQIILEPESNTWVEVDSKNEGLVHI